MRVQEVQLTHAEVAELFGVSKKAVNDWCMDGCPFLDDGLYDLTAVAKWLAQRKAAPLTEAVMAAQ